MTSVSIKSLVVLATVACLAPGCSDDSGNGNNHPLPGDAAVDGVDAGDGGDASVDGESSDDKVVVCENSFDAPPAGSACSTTAGSSSLTMLQGDVLAGDKVYQNGQVLIDQSTENATIACVGCGCGEQPDADTATVVSCPNSVVSPGLINAHEHLGWGGGSPKGHGEERFEHRHDWREGKRGHSEIPSGQGDYSDENVLFGELRHLMGGATSIAGSGGTSGFLRNLDESDNAGGVNAAVDYETFPLGDVGGTLMADGCGYDELPDASVLTNGIFLPHVAEGIDAEAENEFTCLSSAANGGTDVLEDNTSIIHGIGLTAADIAEFAGNGAQLVWSPRTNIDLYGNTADVVTYDHYGVPIALGTDWVLSGSMNLLRELACVDYLNQNHYNDHFSDYEIWQMATANGAKALGVDDQLGTLAEGYVADIAVFDASEASGYRAVLDARAADVQLVMRGGDPVVGTPAIVDALVPNDQADQCESITVCDGARMICAERDTGYKWSEILAATDEYDPFYCDTPDHEPSCVPARPDEYDGMSTANDRDGDGIDDSSDSCPAVFNPMRPLDQAQADYDNDGRGDSCDVCPLTDGETCDPFDPDDRDADGVPNNQDVCPAMANPDQTDSDGDGMGDACDACKDFANPGHTGCPATIYGVWSGDASVGSKVSITGAVVTAVGPDGIFIQYPSGADDFDGVARSGIYLYMPDADPFPTRGDQVDISASVAEYGGSLQLEKPDSLTTNASGAALPDPVEVDPADVATGGADADKYVGVLLRVGAVSVTDANPDGPGDDFGEFAVTGGLRVDDLLHVIEPDPVTDDGFDALLGVLYRSFGNTKLEPRDADDVILGPPNLLSFAPTTTYLAAGATAVPTPELTITLNRAPDQPRTIDLTYSDTAVVSGPDTLDVPANQTSIPLSLTGAGSAGDSAEVTASLDGDAFTTTVELYDDASPREVASLTPASQTIQVDQTGTLTVSLSLPAPSGGQQVDFSSDSGVSAPAAVTVPAGSLNTDVTVTAGANAATTTVTAEINSSSATADVTVTAGPTTPCLIIGEYIEGSSYNKGLELYNCGSTALELSNFGVCQANGSGSECDSELILPAGALAPGAVHTLCHPSASFSCDTTHGSVIAHNGNDRFVIYKDDNASGAFESTSDTVTDAFGKTDTDPGSIWKDHTYRRCDFTPYYGHSPFDVLSLYTEHPKDDATDFGTAPTEGCP